MANKRSGGVNAKAENIDIKGDAVGRDEVHGDVYYGAQPSQRRRAELPNQPYFFGREDELKIIADALDPESNGWGVLIDGPGGMGKTALAICAGHLADDDTYPTKIFLSAKIRELTPQGEQELQDSMLPNFMALITELAKELGEEGIEKTDPNERVKEVRRALENRQALIIIDNLETFEDKERDRVFQFLRRLPRSCKAIVTSRRRTDTAAEIIRLDRLKQEDAMKLILKLSERNKLLAAINDLERQELYEATKGNPLLIEWIVGQLGRPESKCRTIDDACHFLESAPGDNDPLEFIFSDLVETFTTHDIKVLTTLKYFTQPATTKWIADIAGIAQTTAESVLEDLAGRSLISGDVQSSAYILPPLVATFLHHKRPEIFAQTSSRLTKRAYAMALENGDEKYKRFKVLDEQWPTIAAAIPLFLQDDNRRLQRLCDALDNFLEFSGRWDEWLSLSLQAEERAIAANDYRNAIWRVSGAGRIYNMQDQSAELSKCAKRAEAYGKRVSVRDKLLAIQLRGLSYLLEKNYAATVAIFQEELRLARSLFLGQDSVVMALNDLAMAERKSGDYVAAEHDYREALRIAKKIKNRVLMAPIASNLADFVLEREQWAKAEQLAREALPLSQAIGRQETIACDCTNLAKALARQGRKAEGLPYAQRAVEIFTKLRMQENLEEAQATLKECES